MIVAACVFSTPQSALAASERELQISHIERDGDGHVKIRVQAYETEQRKKYPLTTLDQNSFDVIINGESQKKSQFSLQSFSQSRRAEGRAIVWIYDATGVKTVRGLTRSLRALTAQDFPNFTSDYTSIFGVAKGKTIERGSIDPSKSDSVLSLQKKLSSNPKGLQPKDISTDPSLCAALRKFKTWTSFGLKRADQKAIFLLGGSSPQNERLSAEQKDCVSQLNQMNVSIHQIVFANEQRFKKRIWVDEESVTQFGSLTRVLDVSGASRTLATLQSLLDHEYMITAQLPIESARLANQLIVKARYHNDIFSSSSAVIPPIAPRVSNKATAFFRPRPAQAPQKLVAVTNAHQLAVEGWIELLLTAFVTGVIVTIRHIRRLKNDFFSLDSTAKNASGTGQSGLVILNGKQKGRVIDLQNMPCVIGTSWGCDVRLKARGILRKHGRIEVSGDKAIVEDFSHGQIYVNGRSIKKIRAIGHGCVIRLGELQLQFQCGEL